MAEVPLPTPTDNPVSSTDIRDAVYAGAMLDKVVTSTDLTYTDRLGGEHYTVDGIKAEGDKVVEETRQNLIPLSRQYATLAAAQADIANIPEGSTTYYRSPDDSALAIEVINNAGALQPTGRKMPSQEAVDALLRMLSSDGLVSDVFLQWLDKNDVVIARWLETEAGLAFKSRFLSFGPDGFSASNAGVTASRIYSQIIEWFTSEGTEDLVISDKNGLILLQLLGNLLKVPGFTLRTPFINFDVKKIGLRQDGTEIDADGATVSHKGPFRIKDKNGLVAFEVTESGKVRFSEMQDLGKNQGQATGTLTEKQVINLLDGAGAAYASKRHNQVRFPVPRGSKLKKLTIWLGYGQSFDVGGGSFFAIPDDIDLGNIMLGQSPRGSTFVKGLSSYDFGAVGGNTFQPLHEVRQTDAGVISETSGSHGQTIAKAFADEVKRRRNERMQKDNDADVIFGVALCGVAGAPIEDLSKGAAAGYYNRYLTALSGIVQAATAAGYEWEVGGIILNHGEQNNGATAEYYLPYLQTLYGNLIADAMTASGQTTTPIFLINQIGNSFISGRNFGVVEAQRQFVENNPLAFMVGSYAGLPNPVDHLFANSYRWLGAQFAKVADRVMWGNDEANFQMVGAYWSGNTAYIGFSTRVPPLTFKSAYVTFTETMYHDKGFTVSDGSGVLTGTDLTVSIVSDNVIKIVAGRTLSGTVTIMLGDGTSHAGVHNIADSDTEISDYVWESGLPNQPATENIAALNNKHYPLRNFALIQKITAQEY